MTLSQGAALAPESAVRRNETTAPDPQQPSPPAPRVPRPPRERARVLWTPAARLIAQAATAVLLLAALCVLAVAACAHARGGLDDLARTSRDHAAAASELHFSLAALDSQRANALVPGHAAGDPARPVGNRELALISAQEYRTRINSLLGELASDSAALGTLRDLMDGLDRYDSVSGKVEYQDDQQPNRQAGHPPALAVTYSGQAGDIMSHQLLPIADKLAKHYTDQARGAADRVRASSRDLAWTCAGLGLLTLLFLLWWQRDLGRRYRRVFNPALVLATLLAAAVAATAVSGLLTVDGQVGDAVRQGLDPWSRSAQARAVAAEASAAQSRWLSAPADQASSYQAQYTSLSEQLASPSGSGSTYAARLSAAVTGSGRTGALKGLLVSDDGGAPGKDAQGGGGAFGGDSTLDAQILDRYATFQSDDQKLRDTARSGDLDTAAELLTEVPRGHIAFDFYDFSIRLDALSANQSAQLADHTASARSGLDPFPALPIAALGAALVLALAGVRPRLVEYR